MKILPLFIPPILSCVIGLWSIDLLLGKKFPPALRLVLGTGLGLGLSSYIAFFSFLITNAYHPTFMYVMHVLLFFWLGLKKLGQAPRPQPLNLKAVAKNHWPFLLLLVAMLPSWQQAKAFPFGGWDAWSVWNYKAKFLLLSEGYWRDLFDPQMWHTSPHYPLLLPLITLWGWTPTGSPLPVIPLIIGLLFTFLTAALLYLLLKEITRRQDVIIAPLLLLSLPFYAMLAASQYCDIVLSFYLLAGLGVLILLLKDHKEPSAILAGIFLGFLGFTKPEGLIASLLCAFWGSLWILLQPDLPRMKKFQVVILFLDSFMVASLPTVLFQVWLSPGNQTFINGLVSSAKPLTATRWQFITAYLGVELISPKWDGLWLLILAGIFLGNNRILLRELSLIPVFLFSYLAIVLGYYALNTYFEIGWWMSVTLNRILFSLLPVFLLWIFSGTNKEPQKPQGPASLS